MQVIDLIATISVVQIKPTVVAGSQSPEAAMAQLPQTVAGCHAVIAQLLERVKLLEERVNMDSNNASKPPSSNGPGHTGHNRAMLHESEVDRVVDCTPQAGKRYTHLEAEKVAAKLK